MSRTEERILDLQTKLEERGVTGVSLFIHNDQHLGLEEVAQDVADFLEAAITPAMTRVLPALGDSVRKGSTNEHTY